MNATVQNQRCAQCVMPRCLPGSDFDAMGECHWCRTRFPNYSPAGEAALEQALQQHLRRRRGNVDCVVGISGGKDSSFVLHQLVKRYGLRAEAFTYVHDGTTAFSVENADAVCRALGVRRHEVGLADHRHLESFKRFFGAWLNSEAPLAAAMTCVACKHLHLMGTRLAAELGAPLAIWAACPLERPPFIPTQPQASVANAPSRGMLGLTAALGRSLVTDPQFRRAFGSDLGMCVQGCLAFSPKCAYLRWRYPTVNHLEYFEFVPWNREVIRGTLLRETPWKVPHTVVSDWHSDCLFNVFKEYMFQKMLGASYTDAFLSNQVRYRLLSRAEAWDELRKSKGFYAVEVVRALSVLGLEHLRNRCDTGCFSLPAAL